MLKLLFPIMLLMNTRSVLASDSISGVYVAPKSIYMVGYMNEGECLSDGGQWAQEHCFFATQDEVRLENGKVSISTIGHNAHECYLEADLTSISSTTLISNVAVDSYDGEMLSCEVRLESDDSFETLSVTSSGEGCHYFCGMRSVLDIEKAYKQ